MKTFSDKKTRVNEMIRVPQVRLIAADGAQLGIVSSAEALRRAREDGLDLVEVAPDAKPPVCRVMDHGKFLYEQKKKSQESRKKQKTYQVKEVKFRPKIGVHDYDLKLRRMIGFLGHGDKVKATVQFRGREMARRDLGTQLLDRLVADVGDRGVLESGPEMAGYRMHAIFGPPRTKGRGR